MTSLPYPRSHQTIFPQNSRNTETTDGEYPPTDCTEVSDARYSPTDCTDFHRLGGYGIPAIPTQPPNYLPTEFTEHTETTGGEEKSVYICEIRGRLFYARSFCVFCEFRGRTLRSLTICVHLCASVGGYSPPEASVYSVNSVGKPYVAKPSVCICEICGRISSARNFCEFREFRGRTCANKLGVGSVEGIRRAAWVWQGCHTLLRKLPQIARMRTD